MEPTIASQQVMDHPYQGQRSATASCQFMYPDDTMCARMAGEHGPIPTTQPIPTPRRDAVTAELADREEKYRFTVTGAPKTPSARNPNGPYFLPDRVLVEWNDDELRIHVVGPRLSPQTDRPLKSSRIFTGYDSADMDTPGEVPDWVKWIVQQAQALRASAKPLNPQDAVVADIAANVDLERGVANILNAPTRPDQLPNRGIGLWEAPEETARRFAPGCTHGGDCTVHPGVSGIHNFDATAAEVLEAVLSAVQIRHKFDADDVREIAARYGVELRR